MLLAKWVKDLKKKTETFFQKKTYKTLTGTWKDAQLANHQGNANHLTIVRMTTIKRQKEISPYTLLAGM